MFWDTDFAGLPPIELPDGRKRETLGDCAAYVLELPKRQQQEPRGSRSLQSPSGDARRPGNRWCANVVGVAIAEWPKMKDLRDRLERLIADAAECDQISNLAADVHKRASRMAVQFRAMAEELKAEIAKREAEGQ